MDGIIFFGSVIHSLADFLYASFRLAITAHHVFYTLVLCYGLNIFVKGSLRLTKYYYLHVILGRTVTISSRYYFRIRSERELLSIVSRLE